MDARIRILVFGDVQGVFFRAGAQDEARRLGLKGYVRNVPDGSVELVAEGDRGALERLLQWCSHGPAGASVSEAKAEWLDFSGAFADFRIKY